MGSSFSTDHGVSRSLDEFLGDPALMDRRKKGSPLRRLFGKTWEAFGESQGRAVGVPRGDPALRFISFRTHGRPARTASLGSQAW